MLRNDVDFVVVLERLIQLENIRVIETMKDVNLVQYGQELFPSSSILPHNLHDPLLFSLQMYALPYFCYAASVDQALNLVIGFNLFCVF